MKLTLRHATHGLGYLGLVPFVFAIWVSSVQFDLGALNAETLFVQYSAIILTFMAGSVWGRNLSLETTADAIGLAVMTNIIALTAWVSLWLQLDSNVPILALLLTAYLAVILFEFIYRTELYGEIQPSYFGLRLTLSFIVCSLHLLMIGLIEIKL